MESIDRIIGQMKKAPTTSQSTKASRYNCEICKDTGWELTERGTYKKCQCAELESAKMLWKHFGVKPQDIKKLNDYNPYDELTRQVKTKAVEYITKFEEIKGSRENSFGLFGQPGAGKTHVIISIGAALLNKKIPAVYMPYLEAMRELKANVNDDEYYLKLSSRYTTAKVLIIDDLFKDKVKNGKLVAGLNEADIKHILPIINFRYLNYLPTIYSSECTPEMLLNLDEATAGRILETCRKYMSIFKDMKYDYRMKNFMKGE